jgi:hypothetical protein
MAPTRLPEGGFRGWQEMGVWGMIFKTLASMVLSTPKSLTVKKIRQKPPTTTPPPEHTTDSSTGLFNGLKTPLTGDNARPT